MSKPELHEVTPEEAAAHRIIQSAEVALRVAISCNRNFDLSRSWSSLIQVEVIKNYYQFLEELMDYWHSEMEHDAAMLGVQITDKDEQVLPVMSERGSDLLQEMILLIEAEKHFMNRDKFTGSIKKLREIIKLRSEIQSGIESLLFDYADPILRYTRPSQEKMSLSLVEN